MSSVAQIIRHVVSYISQQSIIIQGKPAYGFTNVFMSVVYVHVTVVYLYPIDASSSN